MLAGHASATVSHAVWGFAKSVEASRRCRL